MNKPTLYLIRGLPGSGKSTFAKQLFDSDVISAYFEADQYFMLDGVYKFNPSLLGVVHNHCQESTKYILSRGDSVAVSNTSTTEKEVETYRKIAEDYNATFVSIVVENRHGGTNIHNVPEEKIEQMKNRFSIKL